jgi:hypothetical protein
MSKALNYLENNIINKSDWLDDNKIKISEFMESYHKDEMQGQNLPLDSVSKKELKEKLEIEFDKGYYKGTQSTRDPF